MTLNRIGDTALSSAHVLAVVDADAEADIDLLLNVNVARSGKSQH